MLKILLMFPESCTSKDDDYPIVYRVSYMSGGAGFLPSTFKDHLSKRNSPTGPSVDESLLK